MDKTMTPDKSKEKRYYCSYAQVYCRNIVEEVQHAREEKDKEIARLKKEIKNLCYELKEAEEKWKSLYFLKKVN